MNEKTSKILFWAGVGAVAVSLAYVFWASCIIPLRATSEKGEGREKIISKRAKNLTDRLDTSSIYLYFNDWNMRAVVGKTIQSPANLYANKSFDINMSFHQDALSEIGISYIETAFSGNTVVYPGTLGQKTWIDTGRADAKEYRYPVNAIMPQGSHIQLPALDVTFQTPGVYEMHYLIMFDNYQALEGSCTFNVMESQE